MKIFLSDADDHGLMVIFHGCTIPRGWERMYPNYVGSEACTWPPKIWFFGQHFCDEEAFNALSASVYPQRGGLHGIRWLFPEQTAESQQ